MVTSPLPPETVRLLRLLRKTAAVYLLLQCTHDPLGETGIAALLELDRETVRGYLRSIQVVGLVERLAPRQGWILTPDGRALIGAFTPPSTPPVSGASTAPAPVLEATHSSALAPVSAAAPPCSPAPALPLSHSPAHKMAENPPNPATTAAALITLTPPHSSAAAAQREASGSESDCSESDRFKRARDALRQAGIFEPTASSLATMPHVDAEYVRRHALRARQEAITSGLLVHRLRCADPPPELNRRGHIAGCKCDECQRDRYRAYADDEAEAEIEAEFEATYA